MGPKYQRVLDKLAGDILSGRYAPGQKLPSEAGLVKQFATSRITIGRALRELTQRGMVDRIAGSGTYVRQLAAAADSSLLGLFLPEMGTTEVFDPIYRGIAGASQSTRHGLLWGSTAAEFVARKVAGVFFAPLELAADAQSENLRIVAELEAARIPIVLLDRDVTAYPERSRYDLVGIDNRRAGYLAADHLLRAGVARVHFLALAGGAATVEARIAGFREALLAAGAPLHANPVHRVHAIDAASVSAMLQAGDGFVCVNDRTAGELMHVAMAAGCRIPRDVRIVGIDDVEYASLLPVPLTTVHQPCREIGEAAMAAMLARIERPQMLARDILLECRLVVRQSG
ncbi:MAG TPA: substrate-binding domain-containing protein [Candidatus Sulfopaludibacter sp.]|jgi:DNA-binding LacI/PurR family transcriptional regulator|nr:substrate-binding domain-containing protein [Candidatus Sulfopaludibacter sp.]